MIIGKKRLCYMYLISEKGTPHAHSHIWIFNVPNIEIRAY